MRVNMTGLKLWIGLGLTLFATSANAENVFWSAGATGDWGTAENWSADWSADTVVTGLPAPGDWPRIDSGGTIQISADIDLPGSNIWTSTVESALTQSGGTVTADTVYLSQPSTATGPNWVLEDGILAVNTLLLAWNNASGVVGHFQQQGGIISLNTLQLCLKNTGQIGHFEMVGGTLTAGTVTLGKGGAHQQATFTQTGGTATISGSVELGAVAGDGSDGDSKAAMNLHGGVMTISGETPFVFTQPGAPVYVDLDGGALNLLGVWDFASLTDIANADFRTSGTAATADDLRFESLMIEDIAYTRITRVFWPSKSDVYWSPGADGDWHTAGNWSDDWSAEPVFTDLPYPGNSPRIDTGGAIAIAADVNLPGSSIWTSTTECTITQTGGTVTASSVYASQPASAPGPNWTLQDGTLELGTLHLAWNNAADIIGYFQQNGGSVTLGQLQACLKSAHQSGHYELTGGTLTVGSIALGKGGADQRAVFTQTGGTALVTGTIALGAVAGDGSDADSRAVLNLDGGVMTMSAETPFAFTQPGAPVYVDIDGGTLNMKGDWDFASLTGIVDADFRLEGNALVDGDLGFEPIMIEGEAFTQIAKAIDPCTDPAKYCDDGNPCTEADCTEGACVNTPNTAACDDGDACTESDQCESGLCAGTPLNCADGESCNASTGACEAVADADVGIPSDADVGIPSDADVGIPSDADVGIPSDADVGIPSDADVGIPSDADVGIPSDADAGILSDTDAGTLSDTVVGIDATPGPTPDDSGCQQSGSRPFSPGAVLFFLALILAASRRRTRVQQQ